MAVPLACMPVPAGAALPQSAWTAANAYAGELERVERAKSRVSMEGLFLLAMDLERELITPSAPGAPSPMEELSDPEYASLQSRLRGIRLNRDELLFARPDLRFFVELGERKGNPEDRLFFHLDRMTYPESFAPAYARQQTDYSACTDYGSGKLTRLYGEWQKYGTRHPARYESVVQEETNRIVRELVQGTCACGTERTVEAEFRYFLARHPGSPIVPKIRARLDQLKHRTANIRFNCVPG